MRKAIIIYGGPLGLGIVRSLGEKGIKSIVIHEDDEEVAVHSKYVFHKVKIKNYLDRKELYDLLIKNKKKWKGLLVIPGSDESALALAYYRKQLSKHYVLPVSGYNTLSKVVDKKETYKLADKAGVPRPKTWCPKTLKEIHNLKREIIFPCILKPHLRHNFYKIFKTKLFYINNFQELKKKFMLCIKHKVDVMISELIPGEDTNLYGYSFYIDKNYKFRGGMLDQKLRQAPPKFGVGRVIRTLHNDEIAALAKKFLKQSPKYTGPGKIEFKYDARDGKYKLIEMNARIILWVHFMAKLGINYPYLMYEDWINSKQIKIKDYKDNIYWMHLYNDVLYFMSKKRKLDNLTFGKFISPYLHRKVLAIESIKDPMPMIIHWRSNANDFFNWVNKKLFRKK
ncbi:hypothetical protein JW930_01045 [Candidatus Woesearchaeota archaeon]|nr:hypothetical protein [Candidatus Woesearchaeota archaeon]